MAEEIVTVASDDFGGLSYCGTRAGLLQLALDLRPMIDAAENVPNYVQDFVFGIEIRCQELDLMDEDFNPIKA